MSTNGYMTEGDLEQLMGKRSFRDVPVRDPENPEVTHKFRIRTFFETEWSAVSSANIDLKRGGFSSEGMRLSDARVIALALVDGDGNLLVRGKDAAERVSKLPTWITEPLLREIREFNGLRSAEDEDTAKNYLDELGLDTSSLASAATSASTEPLPE